MNKTKLLLLALCAIALTGCEPKTDSDFAERMTEFEYKGHLYLYFDNGHNTKSGITHDPDCPCLEKGGEDDN